MISAPVPENDKARVASLEKMQLLSTPRMADLDRVTRIAQKYFKTDISLITLVDRERQWFKSHIGLDLTETSRDISFCAHAINSADTFVVEDAQHDLRFFDNPMVVGAPHIRFYAGQPLVNTEGFIYGTLCVISAQPGTFSAEDKEVLVDLAEMVNLIIRNRNLSQSQVGLLDTLAMAVRDKMIDPLTGIWNRRGLDELFSREISRAIRQNEPLAVGIIDIDHFRDVNNRFGHLVGDQVLKQAAEMLVGCARSYDIVSRFGGDEFVIVATNIYPGAVDAFAEKIFQLFRSNAKISTPHNTVDFTISAGFSVYHPISRTEHIFDELFSHADQALFNCKRAGRDQFKIIDIRPGYLN